MSDYCTQYHCAGDCGKRGHDVPDRKFYKTPKTSTFGPLPTKTSTPAVAALSRHRHKKLVMATFDELTFDEKCKVLEQRAEVERKARNQL